MTANAGNKKKVLTSIDTSPERQYIEIDGKSYGVITGMELELKHLAILQKVQTRLNLGLDDESEEGMQELSVMLDKMVRIILYDAPDAIHKKLKDFHRMEIVRSFTVAGRSSEEIPSSQTESSTSESPGSPASSEEVLTGSTSA